MRTISPWLKPTLRLWNRRLAKPPVLKSNVEARSVKNWRFSGKKSGKRVILTCSSSASTWAKSVLIVTSSTKFDVGAYFRSKPTSVVRSRSVCQKLATSCGSAKTGVCLKPPSE